MNNILSNCLKRHPFFRLDSLLKVTNNPLYFHRYNSITTSEQIEKDARKKRVKTFISMKITDPLKHLWHHTKLSYVTFKFGCAIFYVDVAKIYQVPVACIRDRRKMTKNEIRLVLFGIFQTLKFVPFLILVAVPGGELVLPVILKFCPGLLPSGFNTFGKSIDFAIGSKISSSIKTLNSDVSGLIQLESNGRLRELLSKRIKQKDEQAFASTTVGHLAQHLQYFDIDFFMRSCSIKCLKDICTEMGLPWSFSRRELTNNIIKKASEIKSQDNRLYKIMKVDYQVIPFDSLVKMCVNRGINCIGHDHDRLVKRLSRWVKFSIEYQIPTVFMFLTRIPHYDELDYISDIVETSDEINRGFDKILSVHRLKLKRKLLKSHDINLDLYMKVKILVTKLKKPSKFIVD